MKILTIDDNKEITDLLKLILESSGYTCISVNNPKDGLETLHNEKFDFILLDMAMPDMSGQDFLKKMSDEGILGNKIIVITATARDIHEIEGNKIVAIIKKPFTKSQILDALKN